MGCLLHDLRAFDIDDCSPGRGGMAQDDGTRGETFHGEINHCGESRG